MNLNEDWYAKQFMPVEYVLWAVLLWLVVDEIIQVYRIEGPKIDYIKEFGNQMDVIFLESFRFYLTKL